MYHSDAAAEAAAIEEEYVDEDDDGDAAIIEAIEAEDVVASDEEGEWAQLLIESTFLI